MHDIEIPLPPSTGSWPPNPRTERIKMWLNIITTVAALTIAVAAAIKPADGGQNEVVYNQMVLEIKALHEENIKQHEDVMALRKYLEDYLHSSTVVGPNSAGITQPNNPNAPVVLIPVDKSKIRTFPGRDSQPILVLPAGNPPAVPDLHPMPDPLYIPEYKVLVDQANSAQKSK